MLLANVSAATTPAIASTAAASVGLTGSAVEPRPGRSAARMPSDRVGRLDIRPARDGGGSVGTGLVARCAARAAHAVTQTNRTIGPITRMVRSTFTPGDGSITPASPRGNHLDATI